jgi:hypothetical protein
VELEKRGTPTITICTDEFATLGSMEAQILRMPRLPIVTIPHPLGGLKPEEVAGRAGLAFQELVKFLNKEMK